MPELQRLYLKVRAIMFVTCHRQQSKSAWIGTLSAKQGTLPIDSQW
ncbi:hypothetical protein R69608_06220 [Paraburkholderia nemoris]|uniref:Uncharacterized protein n=1 Tax=Paraburkholderia nemoris TaxID=2793076 RepID=A0ABN7NE55_9BURK|nr:hypothetical protein R69619_06333 [Paraburkholderia nemoris]CAE6843712.1 hypothetical protein R75777_07203 [Paraburkholderia nemoris]CAE6858623.1 hypothetical protein R69776_07882 [Paraburkholderia nemoris]CAE6895141.1 hypothetical protein R69749_07835 [Paraburkholderia domus]CAE6957423.1 hypothetical protein R69608_06220 [Paraburkholderia nemoris]